MTMLRGLGLGVLCLFLALAALATLLFTLDLRSELGPRLERMATSALDRQVSIDGAVRFGVWRGGPSLVVEGVRLANAPWGTRPDMVKVGRLEVRARLRPLFGREISVRELVLDGVDALVETRKNGKTNRPRPGALGGKVGLFGRVKLAGPESLSATNVVLSYETQPGMPHLGVHLERMNVRPSGKDGFKFALLGMLRGKLLGIEGSLSDAHALIQGRQSPLRAAVALGNATVLVNGRVGSPTRGPGFALRLEGTAPDLRDFGALVGVPALPEGHPLVFSAALNGAHGRVSLSEFSARLGSGTIVGTLDISERNGAPDIDGVFASEVLDLVPFLGPWWRMADISGLAGRPFALDFFRHAHVDLGYQAQLVKLGTAALEAADVRLLLAGGVLTVYPLSVYNDGNSLEAELSVDFNSGGEGELRAATRRFPLGLLLAGAGHGDALSGDLALSVELTGVGPSLKAMLADLRGQVSLAITNGTLGAKALDYLPQAWRPVYQALGEGAPSVPLSCARGRAMFAGGGAEARAMLIDTGATTTSAALKLDLANGALAALLSPRPKDGKRSAASRELGLDGELGDSRALVIGGADGEMSDTLKAVARIKSTPSLRDPCTATFAGGIVPRVNDPTVLTDPNKSPQASQAAEGSEP